MWQVQRLASEIQTNSGQWFVVADVFVERYSDTEHNNNRRVHLLVFDTESKTAQVVASTNVKESRSRVQVGMFPEVEKAVIACGEQFETDSRARHDSHVSCANIAAVVAGPVQPRRLRTRKRTEPRSAAKEASLKKSKPKRSTHVRSKSAVSPSHGSSESKSVAVSQEQLGELVESAVARALHGRQRTRAKRGADSESGADAELAVASKRRRGDFLGAAAADVDSSSARVPLSRVQQAYDYEAEIDDLVEAQAVSRARRRELRELAMEERKDEREAAVERRIVAQGRAGRLVTQNSSRNSQIRDE